MPRILDNILEELNLSIKQNLDALTDFTNLGTNSKFYRETRLFTRDEQTMPITLVGNYLGEKVSIDDRYPLTIYHRAVSVENENNVNLGYGARSYRERLYNMRLYCFGTLKYLNNPTWDYNVDIQQIVYRTLPHVVGQKERILPDEENSDAIAVIESEFSASMAASLIVRHTAFWIEYQIRQRSDCGDVTNDPVVSFSDVVGLTGNSTVI